MATPSRPVLPWLSHCSRHHQHQQHYRLGLLLLLAPLLAASPSSPPSPPTSSSSSAPSTPPDPSRWTGPAAARVWKDVLPAPLLARVRADAETHIDGLDATGGRVSVWLDLDFTPRDAIERAIARIRDRVILRGGIRPEKLVGVEWWVQARGCRQPLHLHADRDETGWRESKVRGLAGGWGGGWSDGG